jgi:hypothetical protein
MSTKGMSVTAARDLINNLCRRDVTVLALHDFDKAGMSIAGTLKRNTRRYTFSRGVEVVDLGLRLTDVYELDLEASAEDVFDRGSEAARRRNLILNGATGEEVDFLLRRRIELNALPSDQLVAFIERKLNEHGVQKIVPDDDLLREAYQLYAKNKRVEKIVAKAISELDDEDITVPDDLAARVTEYLREHPELRWDEAIAAIVGETVKQ